jgi:uncharacterized alkaline shock family protein YloU
MLFKETTEFGIIRYDRHIIGNIIRRVVGQMNGRAILSDSKGRMRKGVTAKPNSDDISFMELKREKEVIDLTLYIVIKFGAGIRHTATEISAMLRTEITKITGMSVGEIKVVITGVLSKNLSKRHIEVTDHAR